MLAHATIQVLREQSALFDRAVTFRGRPRERLVALSEAEELFFRLHRFHYRALQVVRTAAQLTRAGAEGHGVLRRCETHLAGLLTRVILDAVGEGDLTLSSPRRAEEVAFTLWALAFGTRALMDTMVATSLLGIADGFRTARDAADLLLDALGWRPLTSEWDYEQTRQRIRAEVFPDEWRRAPAA
jgi:hypothetical protein